ncbi:hypothetical protein [Flocculibacter collagenilyticus]|uniref:hypothetical protein n=1 Tax=Flocculibacter collagenilyticus TaxID=2744479 RepID=UPI0018F4E8D7|nr:hypothetical protein [Flocculibacter collagenilyticus]
MKYIFPVFILISVNVFANNNAVLSGKVVNKTTENGHVETFVSEVTLANCNAQISPAKNNEDNQVSIAFSDREFKASNVNVKPKSDGSCLLTQVDGKAIK